MPEKMRASRQRTAARRIFFVAVFAASLSCLSPAILHAETSTLRGYITAVHPPDGFDVNGEHVVTTAETRFGTIGAKHPVSNGPTRDAVAIGAWVEVDGEFDPATKVMAARSVLFRDDTRQKTSGVGLIIRVVATAPEPILAAGGYRIRVTAATEIDYPKNMKSASDVRAGQWVVYEGKLDHDGMLVAGKVRFLAARQMPEDQALGPVDASRTPEPPPANPDTAPKNSSSPPSDALCQTGDQAVEGDEILLGRYKVSGYPTYKISKDRALQARIRRIGMSLVPGYQNQLAPEDPAKIHFLFCAVDDSEAHETIASDASFQAGWILIPAQLARRFKSDDQLAAVLAAGIARALQQRPPLAIGMLVGPSTSAAALASGGIGIATVALTASTAGGATIVVGGILGHELNMVEQEQQLRVALQLMGDAGFDPWQSPEAWRLVAPRKLPADISTLKYPDRSNYQLGILNLMYKKPPQASASDPGPTASPSASK